MKYEDPKIPTFLVGEARHWMKSSYAHFLPYYCNPSVQDKVDSGEVADCMLDDDGTH